MGLSSSKTKTTTNSSSNNNETQNATTTPVTPDWLTQAAQDYVGRIGAFGDMDPSGFVAPAAPLHQMAWQNAASLGDWRGQAATAAQLALQAGSGGPHYAGAGGAMGRWTGLSGLTPAPERSNLMGSAPAAALGGSAQTAANALGGDKLMPAHPSQLPRPAASGFGDAGGGGGGGAFNYRAPEIASTPAPTMSAARPVTLGPAALVGGQSYSAPQLGNASGYAAARTGAPIGANAYGYTASQIGAPQIAGTQGAAASDADPASLLTNLSAYQNPYREQVVNAALADYDTHAAQQRAALEARGAAAGAFGGSRFGIAQGQLEGDLARGRASLEAGLLDQGFDAAAALSGADAANRQAASLFNAQNRTGISQFNAGQDYSRALSQAQLAQQAALANQEAGNSAAAQYAQGQTQASALNAGAGNQFALDEASRQDQAAQFGRTQQQQRDLATAGYANDAARYGADSAMQAALANQAQLGQYGLARFGADTNAASNYAAALNSGALAAYQGDLQRALAQAQLGAQARQFNAGTNADLARFDAGQADNAANRQLQAAAMLGSLANDYGAGTRADLGTMAQLGDQQRAIEQAYAMAGPAQLQLMGQLSGMTPYDILVGRNVASTANGTSTGTGTTVQTQTPSLFNQLLAAGDFASKFIPFPGA